MKTDMDFNEEIFSIVHIEYTENGTKISMRSLTTDTELDLFSTSKLADIKGRRIKVKMVLEKET